MQLVKRAFFTLWKGFTQLVRCSNFDTSLCHLGSYWELLHFKAKFSQKQGNSIGSIAYLKHCSEVPCESHLLSHLLLGKSWVLPNPCLGKMAFDLIEKLHPKKFAKLDFMQYASSWGFLKRIHWENIIRLWAFSSLYCYNLAWSWGMSSSMFLISCSFLNAKKLLSPQANPILKKNWSSTAMSSVTDFLNQLSVRAPAFITSVR